MKEYGGPSATGKKQESNWQMLDQAKAFAPQLGNTMAGPSMTQKDTTEQQSEEENDNYQEETLEAPVAQTQPKTNKNFPVKEIS